FGCHGLVPWRCSRLSSASGGTPSFLYLRMPRACPVEVSRLSSTSEGEEPSFFLPLVDPEREGPRHKAVASKQPGPISPLLPPLVDTEREGPRHKAVASFQGFRAADDFHDLLGDASLA